MLLFFRKCRQGTFPRHADAEIFPFTNLSTVNRRHTLGIIKVLSGFKCLGSDINATHFLKKVFFGGFIY